MIKSVYNGFQRSTLFEKLLLVIGLAIGLVGFWIINTLYRQNPVFSWEVLTVTFLWLLLSFVVILTASNESIKEELGTIIKEHIEETKLMKKETSLIKEEIKVLNSLLAKKKKT